MPNWPRQSECARFYGKPGTGHTSITLPYPVRLSWDLNTTLTHFAIHEKCAESALKVLNRVKDTYGVEKIRELRLDLWGGCFNAGACAAAPSSPCTPTPARSTGTPTIISCGGASTTRHRYKPWWEAWEADGWVSLGRTRDRDWMHVQAARL